MYAITGANGSGKSSFLQVLLSCSSNENPIDLATSINVTSDETESCAIHMPSRRVVEVSQSIYWPLHAIPMDWILHGHSREHDVDARRIKMVLDHLVSLNFYGEFLNTEGINDGGLSVNRTLIYQKLEDELLSEKKDFFSELSGGQQSKIELVRSVSAIISC